MQVNDIEEFLSQAPLQIRMGRREKDETRALEVVIREHKGEYHIGPGTRVKDFAVFVGEESNIARPGWRVKETSLVPAYAVLQHGRGEDAKTYKIIAHSRIQDLPIAINQDKELRIPYQDLKRMRTAALCE